MFGPDAHRYVSTFKDVSTTQPLIGCGPCADRETCGGLHLLNTGSAVVSCMSYCRCEDQSDCNFVCPKKSSEFARRFFEVDGWDLNNIPQARDLPIPAIASWVPLFQGNLCGNRPLHSEPMVALPLTLALRGSGVSARARTAKELARSYGARPHEGWILSGTQDDPAVERIWQIPDMSRMARQFVKEGAVFATTPNFSLVVDAPRYDNLHAMKRIAWAWYHMTQGGLCTALHLNGRTDQDFLRWAEFVRSRPEVKAVAFEFLTGAATKASSEIYMERLALFAHESGRRLPIVVRGHALLADRLKLHFERVIQLDSAPYMRSSMRRKAFLKPSGGVGHAFSPTSSPRETRAMLAHNVRIHRSRADALRREPVISAQSELDLRIAPTKVHADDESGQLTLFAHQDIHS